MLREGAMSAMLIAVAPPMPAHAPPATRAAIAAQLLLDADAAANSGRRPDRDRLAQNIGRLERIGVAGATGEDAAVLARWQERSGAGPSWRGRVLGPAFRQGLLRGGERLRVAQLFLAGKPATVSIASDRQPIRMTVIGPEGVPICAVGTDCSWQPAFTQRYEIEVINAGPKLAHYYLVTD